MREYKTIQNYLVFQELFTDTMGTNFRVGLLENKKPVAHRLMCQVNPLISTSPERLRRVKILLDGIKKAAIPSLYSPMEMVTEENQLYLLYDSFKGRNLEKIFEDAGQKGLMFNFDLVFSIAIAIADIIESGSTIVISGEKSFHGFLTPDNILFHFDGKIHLKNYGIFPYLDKTGSLFSELETRYGNWMTPEFTRKEKLVSQSDIYHLGYIIYKMLTGKYFTLNAGEDFDSKLATMNLKQFIPSAERDSHTHLLNFFKKSLNPDPMKRFLAIKDFKDYIANYFHIEELSSITFNVAYFMNSLYSEVMEREERLMNEELAIPTAAPKREAVYTPPPPEPRRESLLEKRTEEKREDKKEANISDILDTLEKEKKRKFWPWVAALLVIGIVVGGGYYFYSSSQKTKADVAQQLKAGEDKLAKERAELSKKSAEDKLKLQQDIEAERQKLASEAQLRDEERKKLEKAMKEKQDRFDQIAKAEEEKKALEEAQRLKDEEARKAQELADQQKKDAEAARIKEEEQKQKIAEEQKAKPGQEIPFTRLDVKPQIQSDMNPGEYMQRNPIWKKRLDKYKGNKFDLTIIALVDETGKVSRINFTGNPNEDLKSLMQEVVQKWVYKPAEKDGVKVKTRVTRRFLIDLATNFGAR